MTNWLSLRRPTIRWPGASRSRWRMSLKRPGSCGRPVPGPARYLMRLFATCYINWTSAWSWSTPKQSNGLEAGMGISCISRLALMDAFRRGSLVPLEIPGLDLKRQFNFVLHRQKFRTAGIEAFLSLCREVAQGAARSDEIVMKRPDGRRLEFR